MIVLASILFCPLVISQTAPAGQQEVIKRYDFLLKGMDDHRQRLRTGVYRASGRFVSDDPTLGRLDGPITIFSAFDYDEDKFRFDRMEPFREGKITDPGAGSQEAWTKKTRGGQMIRLDGHTISRDVDSSIAYIGRLTTEVEGAVKPLDVRAFGLFYWIDLSDGPATTYPAWFKILLGDVPEEILEERRGIWRVTWTFPEYETITSRRITWIDQNSGFSPIRTELRRRSRSMPPDFWPEPYESSETTWSEVSGIWVPKTYRNVLDKGQPLQQIFELSFNWEVVNGVVLADVFSVKGLKLPPGTLVVDNSTGSELDVRPIDADHSLIDRTNETPPPPVAANAKPKRAWQGWISAPYAFATIGVGVLGLAAWLLFRNSRPRRA